LDAGKLRVKNNIKVSHQADSHARFCDFKIISELASKQMCLDDFKVCSGPRSKTRLSELGLSKPVTVALTRLSGIDPRIAMLVSLWGPVKELKIHLGLNLAAMAMVDGKAHPGWMIFGPAILVAWESTKKGDTEMRHDYLPLTPQSLSTVSLIFPFLQFGDKLEHCRARVPLPVKERVYVIMFKRSPKEFEVALHDSEELKELRDRIAEAGPHRMGEESFDGCRLPTGGSIFVEPRQMLNVLFQIQEEGSPIKLCQVVVSESHKETLLDVVRRIRSTSKVTELGRSPIIGVVDPTVFSTLRTFLWEPPSRLREPTAHSTGEAHSSDRRVANPRRWGSVVP